MLLSLLSFLLELQGPRSELKINSKDFYIKKLNSLLRAGRWLRLCCAEFEPQNPRFKKSGAMVCDYNPHAGEAETGVSLGHSTGSVSWGTQRRK